MGPLISLICLPGNHISGFRTAICLGSRRKDYLHCAKAAIVSKRIRKSPRFAMYVQVARKNLCTEKNFDNSSHFSIVFDPPREAPFGRIDHKSIQTTHIHAASLQRP